MHTYDPQKAARVWQRVQAGQEDPKQARLNDNLQELIMNEWIAAATYLRLARQMQPKQAAVLQRLGTEEHAHAACLKGIYTLITGEKPLVPPPAVSDDPQEIMLRRCYGREMRCLSQYESRMGDPQYGHIFRSLARQEQEHCHKILEILGTLSK